MKVLKAEFDSWHVEYIPEDGARIAVLRYAENDLLTSRPVSFRSPDRFYGEYETRPVYGYDDCFPTVDPCLFPEDKFECRDHGELCWKKWHTEIKENCLICSVDCDHPAVNFKRIMRFEGDRLIWRFEVTTLSDKKYAFLHIMHALLSPEDILQVEIPECRQIFDEINYKEPGLKGSAALGEQLPALLPGSFSMLLLRDIAAGSVKVTFINGSRLEIGFDRKQFPTLGIWWNNGGYPEGGQVRTECAFEPIPGTCSDLSKSFQEGVFLSVEPGKPMIWEVTWTIGKSG